MADFNIVLLLIVIIVSVLVFLVNIYILINYQHPDDANQAYFPKVIVVLGLSIAEISILMLPADVANKESCKQNIFNGACKLTLPMKELWLAIYIIDALLVFIVIPFSIFYYEGDQEKSPGSRACNALIWVGLLCVVIALVLGILYGVLGYVDFSVRRLSSVTIPFTTDFSSLSSSIPCFHPVGPINTNMSALCSGYNSASGTAIWSLRTSFPAYIIALTTIAGSILFIIFGGIGIACFPLSLIVGFLRRPKCVISRAQYIKEATDLNKRAKELKTATKALQQEERSGSKGWKFKSKVKVVQKELEYLEEDVKALDEVFPQGEQAEASWALTTLWYLGKLLFGIIGFCISALWLVHIIIYLLVQPPIAPFLNQIFVRLDKAWGLLGTTAFAFFCFYLMLAVISGEVHLGMRIMFMSVHPMKYHGTLMSSFLFNVGVILLCSISVIQFCTKAFSLYAEATAAQEIFGHTLESLRGLKYLFRYNIFQFTFIILSFLTFIYYVAFGSRKPKRKGKLAFAK